MHGFYGALRRHGSEEDRVSAVDLGRQRERGLVGEAALELDGSRGAVAVVQPPLLPLGRVRRERAAVQLDQRLLDHRLVLPLAPLHPHHARQRHAADRPLARGALQVGHRRHHARLPLGRQRARRVAQVVAVGGVEVGWKRAAALVAKVVPDGGKLAAEGACRLPRCELRLHHLDEQLLRLYLRHLHVAVRVAVQHELLRDGARQKAEELRRAGGQHGGGGLQGQPPRGGRHDLVQLAQELIRVRQELDEPLRDEDDAVRDARGGARRHDVRNLGGDLLQRDALGLHLLADEAQLRVGLQRHLQRDVAGGAPHETHKVVVLVRAGAVDHDVAHCLGVHAARRVETKAGGHLLVLEVAVDGLGHAQHLGGKPLAAEKLREHGRVGVGVVAADNHQAV
mmetsp:Transcript_31742/g.81305  ORF Transcript_31742/g.81305 Transcript_31742/m.81305 type:complete len:396 (-) Transcript_31742:640-1827(-)